LLSSERSAVEPLVLERFVGGSSSNPSFSVDWCDKSDRLDHTLETLARISSALSTAPADPVAVFEAVVEAAADALDARWAAMVLSGVHDGLGIARVFVLPGQGVIERWEVPPRVLSALTDRTLAARGPVVAENDESLEFGGDPCVLVTAPMPVRDEPAGILAVALPYGAGVAPSDVSILVTLANHAGVALHNASVLQENEHRAAELERRGCELERTLRRLEQAGRRRLLSEERNRIARELHDSVAQHLLTIGMNLEWCRRHESTSPSVLERVLAAQSLARSAMDEIREGIFAPGSYGRVELPQALRDVIEDVEVGTGLQVALRVYGQTEPVPAATQHSLVQIAREALFNVVRHADARHAWIALRWRSQVMSLAVADDGTGDHRKLQHQLSVLRPHGDHVGLTGIAERVRGLGGATWFERRRGGGVKLRVEVPVRTLGGASRAMPVNARASVS
jgi:signal transduction histidine kinase